MFTGLQPVFNLDFRSDAFKRAGNTLKIFPLQAANQLGRSVPHYVADSAKEVLILDTETPLRDLRIGNSESETTTCNATCAFAYRVVGWCGDLIKTESGNSSGSAA